MRRSASLFGLVIFGGLTVAMPTRADHFTMDLEVCFAKTTKKAQTDKAALGVKPQPRGVLEVEACKPVTVKWTVTNSDKKHTAKNVLIHFFVVKEDKIGQPSVPKLDKDVPVESALTMDFKPKDKTDGELTFEITTPGCYLLRLETIGAAVGVDGHENFAALDLVVKGK
jgi:hypothetical protein